MNFIKPFSILFVLLFAFITLTSSEGCLFGSETQNKTAYQEASRTERNQEYLNRVQPAPQLDWSLERDNLIKRMLMMNDRSITFYQYVFLEGYGPIGYYEINKVSSVNSQLTNTEQILDDPNGGYDVGSLTLPSPAEDGSYGTNGDAVFSFTPQGIYIEHNMKYIVSASPLSFEKEVPFLARLTVQQQADINAMMEEINRQQKAFEKKSQSK